MSSTTLDLVRQVLEKHPDTRDDIHMLYLRVARALYPGWVFKTRRRGICIEGRIELITLACSVRRYRARYRHKYPYTERMEAHLQARGEQEHARFARGMHP